MPKIEVDYSHTIIYKICCKEPNIKDIYVGHTTNFIKRKNQHKGLCNNLDSNNSNPYVYQFIRNHGGWENWSMIQIEEYNLKNRREAEAKEHYWIEQLSSTLNSNNPYAMCKEAPQLYKQNWYEENKEEILQKSKNNYEENKETKLVYQKQYAEENKEQIKNYQDDYREKNKEKLAEQKKAYREQHKEENAKANKAWRESNKAKIQEKNKQIINCECGNKFTFQNKNRHLLSKVHVDYQNLLCGIVKEEEPKMSQEEKKEISKQKQKEYKEKNAEKIKKFKKEYIETHKEKIKEQTHKYYEEHKEEIKQNAKEYVEKNKEKVKESRHEWYQKNKEKILEKMKEEFTCECGSVIKCGGKAEHNRSTKHKNFMATLLI
jgi:hypothetical protein